MPLLYFAGAVAFDMLVDYAIDKSGSETARKVKDGIDLAMTFTPLGAAKNGGKELVKAAAKEGAEFVSENIAKTVTKTTAKEVAKTTGEFVGEKTAENIAKTTTKTTTKEVAKTTGETLTETIAKTATKEATEALGEKVAKESAKDGTESVVKTAEKKAVEDSTKTSAKKSADDVGETTGKTMSKTPKEMAEEVAKKYNGNKNSVSIKTPNKEVRIDLKDNRGEGHFDKATQTQIETPHVHETKFRIENGKVKINEKTGSPQPAGKSVRPATKEDVRTAKKILEQRKQNVGK